MKFNKKDLTKLSKLLTAVREQNDCRELFSHVDKVKLSEQIATAETALRCIANALS